MKSLTNLLNESLSSKDAQMHYAGLKDMKIIWHGEWSDPEIKYKGDVVNYYALDDALYQEWVEEKNHGREDESLFDEWLITKEGQRRAIEMFYDVLK